MKVISLPLAAVLYFLQGVSVAAPPGGDSELMLANEHFRVAFDAKNAGIMKLLHADRDRLNFVIGKQDQPRLAIEDSRWLGDLVLRYRMRGEPWRLATTGLSSDVRQIQRSSDAKHLDVTYLGNSRQAAGLKGLAVTETYRLNGSSFSWKLTLKNQSHGALEIGDLGLPLPFNTYYAREPQVTYEERVVQHSYIAGDNSFVLLVRPDGTGPYLLMTPAEGTHLEYFDRASRDGRANADARVFARTGDRSSSWEGLETAYIHASVQAKDVESRGTWNQPLTKRMLAPSGQAGDSASYAFTFQWVKDYAAARQALIEAGLLDVQVSPGMVIPSDVTAMLSIGSRQPVESLLAQYPAQTIIEPVSTSGPALWRLTFRRLGENKVTVRWGGGRQTQLEYFVTEPLQVLIRKRAAFIAKNQQVRDSTKWYDGLFSLWDMQERRLRTPDEPGDLHPYMVGGSDDPSLSKAPYLASKNVIYPDAGQIAAIEYYLQHFVWGKLQRTDEERPFPFGIYGSTNWHENRFSETGFNSGGMGREHLWRTFDYPHLVQLYYQMYRIASFYPDTVHYLDARGYLQRAYGTAMAFFEVPYEIKMGESWNFHGWTDWAYKQGAFHEFYIPHVIDALERHGLGEQAAKLRHEWEKKVKYFVYDTPYPFGSEMYFDTTGFQSSHALARYGLEHSIKPDQALWRDKNSGQVYSHPQVDAKDFRAFMDRSIAANIAARGWLESSYYQLGSDMRGTSYRLSYMTQMGGGAVLDYALNYAPMADRAALARLGYASYLGSWALVNSGTPETGYGYWYKGVDNDGAAGWAFNSEKAASGSGWAGGALTNVRGAWRYDGEIDNGYSDALQSAATLVLEDPVFGLVALGGDLKESQKAFEVTPKDGVAQRIFVRTAGQTLDVTLDRDGFDAASPVRIDRDGRRLEFGLQNRYWQAHETTLSMRGLAPGVYGLTLDGRTTGRPLVVRKDQADLQVTLPIDTGQRSEVLFAPRRF